MECGGNEGVCGCVREEGGRGGEGERREEREREREREREGWAAGERPSIAVAEDLLAVAGINEIGSREVEKHNRHEEEQRDPCEHQHVVNHLLRAQASC